MAQRVAIGLAIVNIVLLAILLTQSHRASAQGVPGILRGSGLEIVDEHGRVRASITIYPEVKHATAGRPPYPEVVVLRLHDRNGKPTVKLETHETGTGTPKGSGLSLLGDSDDTQTFIGTVGSASKVELKNGDGQRKQLEP